MHILLVVLSVWGVVAIVVGLIMARFIERGNDPGGDAS